MREVREVMNTIRTYAAPEATIIFGTVFEEGMEDQLRVTVVATGLGSQMIRKPVKPEISIVQTQRTGTYDAPFEMSGAVGGQVESTSTLPPVFQSGRSSARNATVDEMRNSGVDKYDIPAFLRKQAD
jgi:cell division protein FtsZ